VAAGVLQQAASRRYLSKEQLITARMMNIIQKRIAVQSASMGAIVKY